MIEASAWRGPRQRQEGSKECVALLSDNPALTLERRCLGRRRKSLQPLLTSTLVEGKKKKKNKGLERKKNFLFLVFKTVQELQRKKSPTWEGKHSAL